VKIALIKHEHRKMVENIGKQKLALAEKYMRTHIETLPRLMLDYLKELKQKEENFWI
jgi:DNA-binding GntR family transcriptional regulator